jgi:hypothetical protein
MVIMETETLIEKIEECKNRGEASDQYEMAFYLHGTNGVIDWSRVNSAIIDRWSLAGLKYIKKNAYSAW